MTKIDYTIVKTSQCGMTTYCVANIDAANDIAICQALTEAAKDVWEYVVADPGTYTASQLKSKKANIIHDCKLSDEMKRVRVECGSYRCEIGDLEWNYLRLFSILNKFETLAHISMKDRQLFMAHRKMGELVCEARIMLPRNIKAICGLLGNDELRPVLNYPALDLDRRCVVATDGKMMVAKKVAVNYIHYEDNVPATFYLPKEIAQMRGEVTVKLYDKGCAVIDENGTEFSVWHESRYPNWATVWPKYRGGSVFIDKSIAKTVKGITKILPQHGKGKTEALLLTHYPASQNLVVRGYDGAEMVGEERISNCTDASRVPWRLVLRGEQLQKVLALKPTCMSAGYGEHNTLPDKLLLWDNIEEMGIILIHYWCEELEEALKETKQGFFADNRSLARCCAPDGWLLEKIESKYPTCGKPQTKSEEPKEQIQQEKPTVYVEYTFADRLRVALKVKLAA